MQQRRPNATINKQKEKKERREGGRKEEEYLKKKTTVALSLTACKELNAPNNHVSLEADPSPVDFSDENTALANPLISALQRTLLSCAYTPQPTETVRK